jgi:hypothetical protein
MVHIIYGLVLNAINAMHFCVLVVQILENLYVYRKMTNVSKES